MIPFKNIIIIALLAVLTAGAAYAVFIWYDQNTAPVLNIENEITQESNVEIETRLPKRLVIGSINVDAPIIYVGLTGEGAVDTPKGPSEVAWYKLGPRPGAQGSSVITGHFGPWKDGSSSVFDNLHKLKIGDKVTVKDDTGKDLIFIVKSTKIYKRTESPEEVFNKEDGIFLNLITCNGTWLANQDTYNQRLVVFTELEK